MATGTIGGALLRTAALCYGEAIESQRLGMFDSFQSFPSMRSITQLTGVALTQSHSQTALS